MIYKTCSKCNEKFEFTIQGQTVCDNCAQNFGCAVCGAKFNRGTYHNCLRVEKKLKHGNGLGGYSNAQMDELRKGEE